ncbi:hypothetical protein KU6B_20620 [Mameliella alba]|nr:hypothetical protein KU6B_20620 [Mameliella alba]
MGGSSLLGWPSRAVRPGSKAKPPSKARNFVAGLQGALALDIRDLAVDPAKEQTRAQIPNEGDSQ